ncbi:MAG: hypothetical protein Q9169_001166 [Polycauliona sp. 2 TL-2023]
MLTSLDVNNLPIQAQARDKLAIFEDLPFSHQEFERAWKDLCALEVEGQAFRPSSEVLWKVWKSIFSASILKGFSIDHDFDVKSFTRTVEEDDIPPSLIVAVIERLQVKEGATSHEYVRMDPVQCAQWAGTVLLEARTEDDTAMNVATFLHEWKEELPESWKRCATLAALKVSSFGAISYASTDETE